MRVIFGNVELSGSERGSFKERGRARRRKGVSEEREGASIKENVEKEREGNQK